MGQIAWSLDARVETVRRMRFIQDLYEKGPAMLSLRCLGADILQS